MRVVVCSLLLFVGGLTAHADEGKANRLAGERSPYLRQHQFNPVDWYPWGDEAFARARRENRPVFLSIGYAACHWCHVMEHESFEDRRTAQILNRAFVCVKVDREERPDIDDIYMASLYAMGERGGWPATLVLTPEGQPFWGGTYLPRGRLQSLAHDLATRWRQDPRGTRARARDIARRVAISTAGPRRGAFQGTDDALIAHARRLLVRSFDRRNGGRIADKKFPPHGELFFLLDQGAAFAAADDLQRVRKTLDAMDEGGFHDQVAGGFHRYTVDAVWFLPHFEKMLYDNAWLVRAYSAMFAKSGDERDRRTAARCLAWIERALRLPGGGYASSLDADTDGHEGRTYVWTIPQMAAALRGDERTWVPPMLGATPAGNFERHNVPFLRLPLSDWARRWRRPVAFVRQRLDVALERLRVARGRRRQPPRDDKAITAWNGMLLGALARAAVDLQDPASLVRARQLAQFLLDRCRTPTGRLLRFPRDSGAEIAGFCDDHVHVIEGLLELADATGESAWSDAAVVLGRDLLARFADPRGGGFWATSQDAHEALFARAKDTSDNPIPSDNGMAARVCLRLFARTGVAEFRVAADATLARFRALMGGSSAPASVSLVHALALRKHLETRSASPAQKAPALSLRQDVARIEVFVDAHTAQRVSLRIRVQLDEGWHVPAHDPGAGTWVATKLTSAEGALTPTYPAGHATRVAYQEGVVRQYAGTFEIEATWNTPVKQARLQLTLQPCDSQGVCKPPMEIAFDVPLR